MTVGMERSVVSALCAGAIALAPSPACAAPLVPSASVIPALMTWPDLLGRQRPEPDRTLSYGTDDHQVVDLWLPSGKGPHPTVLMLHGGCWTTKIADRTYMNWAAADLRSRGIAVWNIDYRGVDLPGGGYPGTFQDVATAADMLARVAPQYHLSIGHLVAVGHSAGGHLAMWLAARWNLPSTSILYTAHPLTVTSVVSLGGLPDLEAATHPPKGSCRASSATQLVGAASPSRPNVFADTSPAAMSIWSAQTTSINGALDIIAPPDLANAFGDAMARKGKIIDRVTVANSGHIELVAPETPAWHLAVKIIMRGIASGKRP